MGCLDDNAVIAYVERLLPDAERARVAAHLDECEACLAITCAVARSTEAAPATAGPIEQAPGEVVGRYALVEMIGRGAMGAVYVAHDPQLDRRVALKIVRSERYAQGDVRARLSREARAMAKVTHPHVVTVYDAGELDDGVFIAMELVEGQTLARWLGAQDRPWREVVQMFVAVGRGLCAAHAAGIVHRDFKPENVLVDRHGRAAVGDFGLAMAPAASRGAGAPSVPAGSVDGVSLADAHELTRTGVLLGTPRYMSPEQFRGGAVDARSDQFSYAVALYEALYRQAPFAGATVGELRAAVTVGAVCARPAETAVPPSVHRVVVRALAPDPVARYTSLEGLLEDLLEVLKALDAVGRPAHRRWIAYVVAGGVVAAAAATAILLARDPAPAATPAVAPRAARPAPESTARTRVLVDRFANRTGDPRLDDTLDLVVADVLVRSARLDPNAGVELPLEGTTVDALVAMVIAEGRPAVGLHGAVARDGTGVVVSLEVGGAQPGAFAATERAASLEDAPVAAARLGVRFLASLGERGDKRGGERGSEPGGERGGEVGGERGGSVDPVLSRSLDALHAYMEGQRSSFAGEFARSIAPYRRALAADPAFVDARQALGLTLYNLADLPGAIAELERAKQGADRLPDRKRLTLLGDYFGTVGRYPDAIMTYEQLLARWPGDARTEINLVATAIDANSWEVAFEQARRAAKDHPEIVVVRGNLVIAELANGRFDDAVRDGAAMLADIRQPLGASVAAIACAQALLGRGRDARATYDALAALGEAALADEGRVDLALYEGRLDDAEAVLRRHVDPAIASGKTAEIPGALIAHARTRLRRGDRAGAVRAATLAMDSGAARPAYVAAAVALEAGDQAGAQASAQAKINAWTASPLPEWRFHGKLLAGDLARVRGRPRDAIALYQDAALIAPSWMTHERLARAYLAAGAWDDAERELSWCLAHRGEGATFMTPGLSYLPDVLLALARSKDRRHAGAAEVRAAYEAVLALGPGAQHDPITDEARGRIAELSP